MSGLPFMPTYWTDYLGDTAHLRTVEHGAYLLLIAHYWITGRALPDDDEELAEITKMRDAWPTHSKRIRAFFVARDGRLQHRRIDAELERARRLYEVRKESGKKAASVRWNAKRMADASFTQGEPEPQPEPQEAILSEANASLVGEADRHAAIPDCPHREIIALFAGKLPHLTRPRVWEGSRRRAMQARWRFICAKLRKKHPTAADDELRKLALLAFVDYFEKFAASRMAHGFARKDGTTWQPTLEWLMRQTTFQRVLDGEYDR